LVVLLVLVAEEVVALILTPMATITILIPIPILTRMDIIIILTPIPILTTTTMDATVVEVVADKEWEWAILESSAMDAPRMCSSSRPPSEMAI
jgi:hypothetical protein